MQRFLFLVLVLVLLSACDSTSSPQASLSPSQTPTPSVFPAALSASPYQPPIDPARFTTTIDNPYFPLTPGTTYVFEGTSDGDREKDTVVVTNKTKKILGVTCVVVKDVAEVNGEIEESTFDWYAQDVDGNVWYFGEDTKEYDNGHVMSTAGSWKAGVNGAQPGVIMPGTPVIGLEYRQEYYKGEAEDVAKVIALGERITVPYKSFEDVLVTEDRSPLEPKVLERKYYAKGIGVVFEKLIKGGEEKLELVDVRS
jgi:hypothetical protein